MIQAGKNCKCLPSWLQRAGVESEAASCTSPVLFMEEDGQRKANVLAYVIKVLTSFHSLVFQGSVLNLFSRLDSLTLDCGDICLILIKPLFLFWL